MKVAVIYWSGTGNTEAMAQSVKDGIQQAGVEVSLLHCTEFTSDNVAEFSAFAFGCPACGSEELDESEFLPMWESVKSELGDKKIVLFGSYGWGGGQWLETWKDESSVLNIVGTFACEADPDDDALAKCVELGKMVL